MSAAFAVVVDDVELDIVGGDSVLFLRFAIL